MADIEIVTRRIEDGLELVNHIVFQAAIHFPRHVDRDDLARAGALGLVEAAKRFDESNGVPFQHFAAQRIRGAILDAVRAADWAPRSVRSLTRKLDATEQELASQLGRVPLISEVADQLGVSREELHRLRDRLFRSVILAFDQLVEEPSRKAADRISERSDQLSSGSSRGSFQLDDDGSMREFGSSAVVVTAVFQTTGSPSSEDLLDLAESMSQWHVIVDTMIRGRVQVSAFPTGHEPEAVRSGIIARTLYQIAHMAPSLVSYSVLARAEYDRLTWDPEVPGLVGVSEIAALLGVSRQHASRLAKQGKLGAPVATLGATPVWTEAAVHAAIKGENGMARLNRHPGRPRKQAERAVSTVHPDDTENGLTLVGILPPTRPNDTPETEPADDARTIEQRELHAYLRDAIALLPERQRLVIVGYFLQDRSAMDLARILGVTESRVAQMRTEALEALKAGIERQFGSAQAAPAVPGELADEVATFAGDDAPAVEIARNAKVAIPSAADLEDLVFALGV